MLGGGESGVGWSGVGAGEEACGSDCTSDRSRSGWLVTKMLKCEEASKFGLDQIQTLGRLFVAGFPLQVCVRFTQHE